ncbi:cupredoxin family copper-binding protein [Candidatus Microgenomates bacterium]|nr:cupredoxin family copper-binding protein [Candidatus Microgenomates bacterium]
MQKGNTNSIAIVITVIVLIVGAIFMLSRQNKTIAPEKESSAQAQGGALHPSSGSAGIVEGDQNGQAMQSIDIKIKDSTFNPFKLTIKKGTSITWKNYDSMPHTVTASDKSFDSGSMAKDKTFTHTFTTVGTYDYVCTFHSNMKAQVIVQE